MEQGLRGNQQQRGYDGKEIHPRAHGDAYGDSGPDAGSRGKADCGAMAYEDDSRSQESYRGYHPGDDTRRVERDASMGKHIEEPVFGYDHHQGRCDSDDHMCPDACALLPAFAFYAEGASAEGRRYEPDDEFRDEFDLGFASGYVTVSRGASVLKCEPLDEVNDKTVDYVIEQIN